MTKQVISLSDQAADRIKEIMSSADNDSINNCKNIFNLK